jgi:hypothetical protein
VQSKLGPVNRCIPSATDRRCRATILIPLAILALLLLAGSIIDSYCGIVAIVAADLFRRKGG